jgi:hypothetical protein
VVSEPGASRHHYAYVTSANLDLYYAVWDWKSALGPGLKLLFSGVAPDSVDIALDAGGQAWISFGVGGAVRVAWDSKSGWVAKTVAKCASGDVRETRIARGPSASGEVHVTYSCAKTLSLAAELTHACRLLP